MGFREEGLDGARQAKDIEQSAGDPLVARTSEQLIDGGGRGAHEVDERFFAVEEAVRVFVYPARDAHGVGAEAPEHAVERVPALVVRASIRERAQHPDVRAVSVIGTPDERWGESVTAVVVPEEPQSPPTLEELRATCSQLAGFKHPRRVVLVEELPTNASGKVDKVALRSLV